MPLRVWLRMPELRLSGGAPDANLPGIRSADLRPAPLRTAGLRGAGIPVGGLRRWLLRLWLPRAATGLPAAVFRLRLSAGIRADRLLSTLHRSVAFARAECADVRARQRNASGPEGFAITRGSRAPRRDTTTIASTLPESLGDIGARPLRCAARALVAVGLASGVATTARAQTRDSLSRADSGAVPRPALRAPIRLCAGGDVTLGTNLDTLWAKNAAKRLRLDFGRSNAPDSLLAPVAPLFTDADVVLVNVEGAIGDGPSERKCGKRAQHCFAFRQPPSAATALRHLADSGVVVGNVANNHSRDAGDAGFLRSVGYLTKAGVLVTGADTLATPVVTRRGDTIGVIGFYTSSDSPDARDLASVRRHVERAVARYGIVIVTMHLGAEGVTAQRTRDSTELFLGTIDRGNPVAFANAALDAGATMVIGHGPHVLRAAEWRGDRLVIYSLGNLLTYGPFRLEEPLDRGTVACADIDSVRHVRSAWLRPTVQPAPGILRPDSTNRAAALMDSLSALDFPTTGASIGRDGVLRRRAASAADQRSGAGKAPTAVGGTSAIHGMRATPRHSLILGAGARLSGLSMTRPATLLAWTKRPPPT